MPQQRSDQHHPPGTPTMMHSVTAAGPPIVAPSPAYSAQYFACSPQQFSQPLVQQMPHYQSQVRFALSLPVSRLDKQLLQQCSAQEERLLRTICNHYSYCGPISWPWQSLSLSSCSLVSYLSDRCLQSSCLTRCQQVDASVPLIFISGTDCRLLALTPELLLPVWKQVTKTTAGTQTVRKLALCDLRVT